MKLKNMWKRFWTLDVHNHEGFTLVELIIVIAILAILSTGAIAGYSAYVTKAKEAVDQQLLAEINQAFRFACIDNMCDSYDIDKATWDMDAMTVASVEDDSAHPIVTAFTTYFDGAKAKFEIIEEIWFNPATHEWEEDDVLTYNFDGKEIKLSASDVAILSGNNAFSNRGSEALLEDVGLLENLLQTGIGEDVLNAVANSEEFAAALNSYLGLDPSKYETTDDYEAALEEKLNANEDAIYTAQILFAASNAAKTSQADIDKLFTGTITSNIEVKNPDGTTNNNATMANAALAYGMYTAYKQQYPNAENVDNFTLTVNSDAFATYFASKQGQADLEAYQAAMNMISDNSGNPEITGSIMENGIIGNTELEDLMKEVMGN